MEAGTNLDELEGKVVLNVDDNEMNQLVIAKILDTLGMVTVAAKNGEEAIQKLTGGLAADVILMDLQMPVMNGIQATEIIRKKINSTIPIIINTGSVEAWEKWRLNRIGVTEFLEKPYSLNDIYSRILRNLPAVEKV